MKTAICDCRIPSAALHTLEGYCDKVLLLPPFEALQDEVASHPDMLLFLATPEKTILTHSEYLHTLDRLLAGTEYRIEAIPEAAEKKYPGDILLNAFICGGCLFGKLEHVSSSVLDIAEGRSAKKINARQGYCRCSSVVLAGRAIITADKGIADAAERENIDVLRVSDAGVSLDGYDKGFIGGASGCDGENVYFCGDISTHPSGAEIVDFCEKHGFSVISLSREPLYDIGTIFFI